MCSTHKKIIVCIKNKKAKLGLLSPKIRLYAWSKNYEEIRTLCNFNSFASQTQAHFRLRRKKGKQHSGAFYHNPLDPSSLRFSPSSSELNPKPSSHFHIHLTVSELSTTTGIMEPHLLHPTNLRFSTSTSTSATYSITLCGEHAHKRNPTIHCLHLSKRSSNQSLKAKKELSRLLRTDAAVRNIEKKANSNKYNNLWPKAVLEALDEAIANNLWESALKVCGSFFFSSVCFGYEFCLISMLDFWLFGFWVCGVMFSLCLFINFYIFIVSLEIVGN